MRRNKTMSGRNEAKNLLEWWNFPGGYRIWCLVSFDTLQLHSWKILSWFKRWKVHSVLANKLADHNVKIGGSGPPHCEWTIISLFVAVNILIFIIGPSCAKHPVCPEPYTKETTPYRTLGARVSSQCKQHWKGFFCVNFCLKLTNETKCNCWFPRAARGCPMQ